MREMDHGQGKEGVNKSLDASQILREIDQRLTEQVIAGNLTDVDKWNLQNLLKKVCCRLAGHYKNLLREVESMGGNYIKLPSDIVYEEGREKGLEEGRVQGFEPYVSLICKKLRKKKSLQQIAQELEEDEETVKKVCDVIASLAPDYPEEKAVKKYCEALTFG